MNIPLVPVCGDGLCQDGEQCESCPEDCGLSTDEDDMSLWYCCHGGPIPSPPPAGEQKKPVLNATQKALSEERLESIKASLLSQGIDGQRIVPCATELDNGEEAKPRVSFGF